VVDLLKEHLTRARASGGIFARTVARPPWGICLPGTIQLTIHAVIHGEAWLWLNEPEAAIKLVAGDVALVRGGSDHNFAHSPHAQCLTAHEFFGAEHRDDAQDPDATIFLCGAYQFAGDVGGQLLAALAPTLTLSPTHEDPLHDVISLLSRELETTAPGQQTILDRLLDVVLIHAMRAAYRDNPRSPGWYRASSDSRLNPALRAMHGDPGHAWAVPELAALSGLSRAAFARVFQQTLGQAPMQYLTEWRMTLARDHLRSGDLTLTQIAQRTGYTSPYAFASAFRRHHGEPPGRWRQGAYDSVDASVTLAAGSSR
jgi:AraC-like DNA-binding protein